MAIASSITWPAYRTESELGKIPRDLEGGAAFTLLLPSSNTVHVWAGPLDVPDSDLAAFKNALSLRDLDRAGRFHFERDRNRFIVAHGWLRQLLSSYLSVPPEELEFKYGAKGKPALSDFGDGAGLEFNMTHAEGLSLIAVCQGAPVGIDLERIRPLTDAEDLVERFFSKHEIAAFKDLPDDQKAEAFFNLWTRKESWLKSTGEGIAHLLDQVEVTFAPGDSARLLRMPEAFAPITDWSLCDLAPAPGFAAALAVAAADAKPECRRWDHTHKGLHL
jgi:4'-phosphopantetheinyl transferase